MKPFEWEHFGFVSFFSFPFFLSPPPSFVAAAVSTTVLFWWKSAVEASGASSYCTNQVTVLPGFSVLPYLNRNLAFCWIGV